MNSATVSNGISSFKTSLATNVFFPGIAAIICILLVSKFIAASNTDEGDISPKMNTFISFSVKMWGIILIILLVYGMFFM